MLKKLCFALALVLIIGLCGCSSNAPEPSQALPHEVDVLRLDTPTPAPTPPQYEVEVYFDLGQAQTLLGYSKRLVQPLLVIHSGWAEAENITAEELGRFFVALGDERRGYSIDAYFVDNEYLVPSEQFAATISACFVLSSDYLLGLSNYDSENDCFVIPAAAEDRKHPVSESIGSDYGYADVYRVEERGDERRIRYRLYCISGDESTGELYYSDSGNCYELVMNGARYINSAPVSDEGLIPAPKNGVRYINSEISDYYARRGIAIGEMRSNGDLTLVDGRNGDFGTIEVFDRISGRVTSVASYSYTDDIRSTLVSEPFSEFEHAGLTDYSLEDDGSVHLLVSNLISRSGDLLASRVYTQKDGKFGYELYCRSVRSSESIGSATRGSGSLYAVIPGRDNRIALIFGPDTKQLPRISVGFSAVVPHILVSGVRVSEDFELPSSASPSYELQSVTRLASGDFTIDLTLSGNVKRYRVHAMEPVAGELPYVEIELITTEVDYPENW